VAPRAARAGVGLSAFLRKTDCVDGILALLIQADPLDCSLTNRPHKSRAGYQIDPIATPHVGRLRHDDEITGLDELVGFKPNRLPALGEFFEEPS
jgi:hypothetical protein